MDIVLSSAGLIAALPAVPDHRGNHQGDFARTRVFETGTASAATENRSSSGNSGQCVKARTRAAPGSSEALITTDTRW